MNEVVKSKYKYELAVCYPVSDAFIREKDAEILESLVQGGRKETLPFGISKVYAKMDDESLRKEA